MPFSPFLPRSLTAVSVSSSAPPASGIYGISNAREWIYIGQTDNIRATLLGHLREHSALMKEQPTGYVFELCDPAARSARQDRLVFEYEPRYNRTQLNP
jgi:hypothetical protein